MAARQRRGDRVYTPSWCAADLVAHFQPRGRILEPFKGQGAILQHLPLGVEWCEIDEGRDFFLWTDHVDWIVSNPPYSLTRKCFAHARRVANHVVFLVPLRNVMSGYGFISELLATGGLPEIRLYGTGSALKFPMGNCIGAVYWRRGFAGTTRWTDYRREHQASILDSVDDQHAVAFPAVEAVGLRVSELMDGHANGPDKS